MDTGTDEQTRAFLTTCFQENLAHLRHIENERITFFSLYLVMVGMLIGIATGKETNPVLAVVMTLLLLVMGLISTVLLRRWNQVFSAHRDAAKTLCTELRNTQRYNGEFPFTTNMLFIFDNKQYLEDKAADRKKRGLPPLLSAAPDGDGSKKHKRFYIHTSGLFRLFNLTIILLECGVLVLNILRLAGYSYGL